MPDNMDYQYLTMEIENVLDDYSCGNCGWTGANYDCDLFYYNKNDAELRCPDCGSSQVGEITEEDFYEGNALHGRLWRGQKILDKRNEQQ